MTRFTVAPRLITPTRKRKQRKAEAQEEMASGTTYKRVTLTDAETKALGAGTDKVLVEAPGAGYVVVFQRAVLISRRTSDYTNLLNNAFLSITADDGADSYPSVSTQVIRDDSESIQSLQYLLTDASPKMMQLLPVAHYSSGQGWIYTNPVVLSQLENCPLVLHGDNNNTGEAFTGGHADNTLVVDLWYHTVATS